MPAVESDQFYFIGFEAPLGSISQTGQAQSGVLLRWDTLEAHTEGFRGSGRYKEWRAKLHHFYEPFPAVEHYGEPVVKA